MAGIRAVACCWCPLDDSYCQCSGPDVLPASACRGKAAGVEPMPHCDTRVSGAASHANPTYHLSTLHCGNLLPWSGVDVDAAGAPERMSGAAYPTPAIHAPRGSYTTAEHGVLYFGCDGSVGLSALNDHLGVALAMPRLPEVVDFVWKVLDGIESCALWPGLAGHAAQFRALYEGTNLDAYLYAFTAHGASPLGDETAPKRYACARVRARARVRALPARTLYPLCMRALIGPTCATLRFCCLCGGKRVCLWIVFVLISVLYWYWYLFFVFGRSYAL